MSINKQILQCVLSIFAGKILQHKKNFPKKNAHNKLWMTSIRYHFVSIFAGIETENTKKILNFWDENKSFTIAE